MHPSQSREYRESQKQKVLALLKTGPKENNDVGRAVGLLSESTSVLLGMLKKQGVVCLVRTLGDKRMWCLPEEHEELQRVHRALIKNRKRLYRLKLRAQKRKPAAPKPVQPVQPVDPDQDDWPVQQSRVTEWAPIRPPAPVSVFTLVVA